MPLGRYDQPRWKRRRRVKHFVAALAIGGLSLTLSYLYTRTEQGWTRETVVNTKHLKPVFLATVIFLTTGVTWAVPKDCFRAQSVECIGAGGGGANANGQNGGAGGGYSKIVNFITPPLSSITIQIGAGGPGGAASLIAVPVNNPGTAGTDTFWNSTVTVLAKGGGGGPGTNVRAVGGATATGVGTTKTAGGNGGLWGTVATEAGGSGGGGAGGPSGNGIQGVDATVVTNGGYDGGAGDNGVGGAAGLGSNTTGVVGGTGGAGAEFTASVGGTAGSGGGGGGGCGNNSSVSSPGNPTNGGPGGNYGAGGGAGATDNFTGFSGGGGNGTGGLIVITYLPPSGMNMQGHAIFMAGPYKVATYGPFPGRRPT